MIAARVMRIMCAMTTSDHCERRQQRSVQLVPRTPCPASTLAIAGNIWFFTATEQDQDVAEEELRRGDRGQRHHVGDAVEDDVAHQRDQTPSAMAAARRSRRRRPPGTACSATCEIADDGAGHGRRRPAAAQRRRR
jgi:hypothetical protein